MPLGLVGVRQECRRRRAAAEGGSRYGQATGADGVGRPAVVGGCCSFVAARGDGGKRAGWLLIFAAPHVHPAVVVNLLTYLHPAALPGKPDPAICPALTNTPPAPLGLAPELQTHEICSRCVARAWCWMDNPLTQLNEASATFPQ